MTLEYGKHQDYSIYRRGVVRQFHSAQHSHLLFTEPRRKQNGPPLLYMNIHALVTLRERAVEVSFRDNTIEVSILGKG